MFNSIFKRMPINDCIHFANENKVCFLANTVGDQPHVRALQFWFADKTGFYFQSSTIKEFISQLYQNPKTEVCFYENKDSIGKMLRIKGEVEFLDDMKLKEKVIADRPFLKTFKLTPSSPELSIFRISHGKAHFWTMKDNLKPKEYIDF